MNNNNSNQIYGANARMIWQLLRLIPEESAITINFYLEGARMPEHMINLWKNNHEDYPEDLNYPSFERAKKELYDYIGYYGIDSYRMNLTWNYGFGNSIVIDLFRPELALDNSAESVCQENRHNERSIENE